jgi:hypothetical protein
VLEFKKTFEMIHRRGFKVEEVMFFGMRVDTVLEGGCQYFPGLFRYTRVFLWN